jgi:hypothetical protein
MRVRSYGVRAFRVFLKASDDIPHFLVAKSSCTHTLVLDHFLLGTVVFAEELLKMNWSEPVTRLQKCRAKRVEASNGREDQDLGG